jgi:pimeloyl-ACP methyl ester carboxylesterase
VGGLSLAVADWLRAIGRRPGVLVGNSAGCQVVADLAVHAPELVGPVVMNGPTFARHARHTRCALTALAASYADCGLRQTLRT